MVEATRELPRGGLQGGMVVAQGDSVPCQQPPAGALQPVLLLN